MFEILIGTWSVSGAGLSSGVESVTQLADGSILIDCTVTSSDGQSANRSITIHSQDEYSTATLEPGAIPTKVRLNPKVRSIDFLYEVDEEDDGTSVFRDTYEFKGTNTRYFTAAVQSDEGSWDVIGTAKLVRIKQ